MKKQLLTIIVGGFFYQANAQIVITGVMGDPVGADAPKSGTEVSGVEQKGGYEYIQLMATKNIDFSKENYALVIARNSEKKPVTAKGWAEGRGITYKINLMHGQVEKGQFFYVGGAEKLIAGYSEALNFRTTYIGEDAEDKKNRAIWIGAKDISKKGDGFGSAPNESSGLMPNGISNTYAIAVFTGTKVDANSIPIDAVFFGQKSSAWLMYDGRNGYLVPIKSDLYEANNRQKYFGQGSNTAIFAPQKTTERGNFAMLAGIYNARKKEWQKSRKATYITLVPSLTPAVNTKRKDGLKYGKGTNKMLKTTKELTPKAQLSDIEEGNATTLIN